MHHDASLPISALRISQDPNVKLSLARATCRYPNFFSPAKSSNLRWGSWLHQRVTLLWKNAVLKSVMCFSVKHAYMIVDAWKGIMKMLNMHSAVIFLSISFHFPCARLACGKCVDINIQQIGYQRSICPSTYVSLRVAKLSTRRRMAREHRGAGSSLVATIWLQTILLESSNSSNFLRKLLKSAENLTVSSEKTRELSSFHHQVQ